MSSFHGKQTTYDGIHTPISYIFPNASSRLASSGYLEEDEHKFAIDLDTKHIFCLIDWQNNTWNQVSGESGSGGGPTGSAGGDLQGTYPNPQVKDLTISGEVQGSILYFNGTNWVHLAPSNDGYVLTTHGSSQNPTWTKVVGSGGEIGGSAGGDLTGTYPNPSVANNVITFSKIQTISTNSLLGRDTAGTGNVEEISLNSTLEMNGSNALQRAAISGDITIPSGSNTAAITSGVIVNSDINASAGINLSKLESIATTTLVGNPSGSSAVPSQITLDSTLNFNGTNLRRSAISGDVTIASGSNTATVTDLTISGEVQGSILYFNGTNWVRLAPGTSGQYLQTQGNLSNPIWVTPDAIITDHGALTGLSDDDHTQYLLANGSRSVSGNFTVNGDIILTGNVDGYDLNQQFGIINNDINSIELNVSTLNSNLNSHTTNTSNPHNTSIANLGSGTLLQLNNIISDADLDAAGTSRPPNGSAGGDLTGTYPNPTITNDAVTTSKLLNNNVTFAKIQTIATDSLLGRDTAGTGNVENITLNSTLQFTGTGSIGRSAISGDVTIASGSNTATVTDLTISGEVQGSILYYNGTNWVHLAPGTAGDVLQTQGAAANPTWATVSSGSATPTGPAGGNLGGSYPNPTVVNLTISSQAQGDLLYFNGTAWVRLPAGTSGQLLQTNGTGANPQWTTVGGTNTFSDSLFRIQDNADSTKQIAFEASGITTGTTRTITIPDANVNLTGLIHSGDSAGGDLTGTYPNPTITNDAVTFAKIQNITTDRLLGRDTAGSGDVEEISLNSTLEFSGTGSIQRAALTGDVTASAGSNSTTIIANAITTTKVLNNNITFAKIQQITTDRLLGRDTTGTGNVEEISLDSTLSWSGTGSIGRSAISGDVTIASGSNTATVTDLTITGESQGSVLYFNGTNWVRLAPGTSGQYLQTQGAAANPQWSTVTSPSTFSDSSFRIQDNADATKQLAFEVSGIATATTRTITVPNANITIDDISSTRTPTDDTVSTVKLQNDAVTFAKIQNINTDRLLGRDTALSGDVEEISLNSTLEFTGTGSIGRSALTGDVTAASGSNATSIANNAVTTVKIADNNITSAKIADNNIITSKIADNNITFAKIQTIATDSLLGRDTAGTGNVENITLNSTLEMTGSGSLQRAAISGDITISAGSNTAAISSGVIINSDINASAGINISKLESITASTLMGNPTGAGAVPSLITLDSTLNFNGTNLRRSAISGDVTIALGSNTATVTDLTISGEAQGSILYYNGTNWVQLSPGTSGQYLQTQGAAANPTWATVSGGSNTFSDSLFRIQDNADATKQLAFEVSGITTGTTRTITVPNANITIDDVSSTRTPTDNTVSTIKIIDNNVTFAKFQQIATDRLLGRDTASTGNVEEISLNSTLVWSGTGSIGRAAISGDVTIASGSNTATVTDLTITSEQQGSVLYYNGTNWVQLSPGTSGQYLQTQGAAANPIWSTVTSGSNTFSDSLFRIQDNTDATKQLAFEVSGITTATTRTITIPDANVNLTGLIHSGDSAGGDLSGTYPNPTIANTAVTFSKIQNITTDRLLGRDTTGSGSVEEISLDSTLSWSGTGSIGRSAISGDITIAAGSNTAAITSDSIVNSDINSSAGIAYSKLANIAATSILGNSTGVSASASSLTLGASLEFSGSTIQRAALTGDVTASANSNSTSIANNVVTFAKMQTVATDSLLGRDTAGTGNIESITLDSTLAFSGSGSIGRAAISGDITISAGSNTAAITSGVIINSDINASAGINLSKLESITASTLVGNPTGAGAVPSLITLNSTLSFSGTTLQRAAISGDVTIAAGSNTATVTDLTISGEAQGDILYFNGTNWVRLGAGTNGQYLKTQGTGANPQWSTVPAAANWFITENNLGSISGSVEIPFDGYRNVAATINGNTTFTFNASATVGHYQLRLSISGTYTVGFPSTVYFPGGVAYTPSGTGGIDIINFFKDGSSNWYATIINDWSQV